MMPTKLAIIDTPAGILGYRDEFDLAVIKEVIYEDGYRRWGDIKISKGTQVIDAGAHIGSFTVLAQSCGAIVTAIEPDDGNRELFEFNTGITAIDRPLSNNKTVDFVKDGNRNELHHITPGNSRKAITLDEVIGDKEIDLLKMDIEGAEYEVLFTSKKLNQVNQISMEYHGGGTKLGELLIFLESRGFKLSWLGGQWFGHLQVKR